MIYQALTVRACSSLLWSMTHQLPLQHGPTRCVFRSDLSWWRGAVQRCDAEALVPGVCAVGYSDGGWTWNSIALADAVHAALWLGWTGWRQETSAGHFPCSAWIFHVQRDIYRLLLSSLDFVGIHQGKDFLLYDSTCDVGNVDKWAWQSISVISNMCFAVVKVRF